MSALVKARSFVPGALAAFAVVVLGGAVCGAERAWPMKKYGDLWVVETPHYVLETDHDSTAAQVIAGQQEALFRELYRRMGKTRPVGAIERMKVQVYRTEDRYRKALGGKGEGTQGLYTGTALSAWGPPEELDAVLETLRHEGTHQFVGQFIGDTCPVWLNEGLAVFFQNARFDRGRLLIGQVPIVSANILKTALKDGQLMPVSKMLKMSYQQWTDAIKTKSDHADLQYPLAWSMVHFLEEGENGKYRAPFLQYVYYLSRRESSEQAWQRAFGTNTPAFQKQLHAYIKDLKPTCGLTCRAKLGMLGDWVLMATKSPQVLKDMKTFRTAALTGAFGGWTVTVAGVETEITDREGLKDLFRCPHDTSRGDAPSYELVPGKPGEPPVVRCTHHAGVVLETKYVKDDQGNWTTTVISRPASRAERGRR